MMRTRRITRRSRPGVEPLEGRTLLSLVPTTTSISASVLSPILNQAETLTATVASVFPSGATPTGTVTFYDGATWLGTSALATSGGITSATLASTSFAVGSHPITATYSGDSNFIASESRTISTPVGGLSGARAVAVDAQGDLFISSIYGNDGSIQEVRPDGSIAFYRGGGATALVVDAKGDLFYTDGSLVKEVEPGPDGLLSDGTTVTIAGGGPNSASNPVGPATDAYLDAPAGLALDAGGNLYITDLYNRVLEVTPGSDGLLSDGTIATIAGLGDPLGSTGRPGFGNYFGDGGPAISASLWQPSGLAINAQGDLIIADSGNNVIRELTPGPDGLLSDGIITTIAGTGGYDVQLMSWGDGSNVPTSGQGLVIAGTDNAGLLHIRTFDAAGVRTGAGVRTDTYEAIEGGELHLVSADASGHVQWDSPESSLSAARTQAIATLEQQLSGWLSPHVLSDSQRDQVLNEATLITGLTRTGTPGYSGDGGPATAATLAYPSGVALDSAGDLFITSRTFNDPIQDVIREITPDGTITTIAGGGATQGDGGPATAAYLYAEGIASDTRGNLFVADGNGVRELGGLVVTVRAVTSTTTSVVATPDQPVVGQPITLTATVATTNPSGYPGGVHPTGTVTFYDGSTALGTAPLSTANGVSTASLSIPPATVGAHSIVAVYAGDPGFTGSSSAASVTIQQDATTTTLVANQSTVISGQQVMLTATVAAAAPGAGTPTGTVTFYDGSTSLGSATLTTSSGVTTGTLTTSALAVGRHSLTAVFGGDASFTTSVSQNTSTVAGNGSAGYSGDGGPATAAALDAPTNLAMDSAGDLFIADCNNHVVREVKTDGTIVTVAGNGTAGYSGDGGPATAASLDLGSALYGGYAFGIYPTAGGGGLALDAAGDLFIADSNNNVVREVVKATGDIITVAGNGIIGYSGDGGPATSAALNGPSAVAVDSQGNLFIADSLNGAIREVHPDGTISTAVFSGPLGNPSDIVFDDQGNLFIADFTDQYVLRVTPGPDGQLSDVTIAGNFLPAGAVPVGIAVDGRDDLAITFPANGFGLETISFDGNSTLTLWNQPEGVRFDGLGDLYIASVSGNVVQEFGGLLLDVQPLTATTLRTTLDNNPQGGSITLQSTSNSAVSAAVQAVNGLTRPATPETVTLDLGGGTFTTDTHVNAPQGVTLVIVNGTLVGGSPALVVDSGDVVLNNVTARNATNAPTIVVSGGSLTIRNSTIQESTSYAQTAILVTGGTVDLGTANSPGGNVINVNGGGALVEDTSGQPVSAIGDTFTINGVPMASSSLSGVVFSDFNDDGEVDFGEQGIRGVPMTVTGTDFLGASVQLSQTTDADGTYVFLNLLPGTYTITETQQPSGFTPGIVTAGTGGGSVSGFQITVSLPAALDAMNNNYGELPVATGGVRKGQTAGIGFWNNKRGQALIEALNGGVGTRLGDWLAATFPHMFGSAAGSDDLAGHSNAAVAAFFQKEFVLHGVKLDAQVLATALSVYVTNATLDSTGVGSQYGFTIAGNGVATATWNVGTNGAAFGVADNTVMTVIDLLLAADAQAVNGVLYNGDTVKRTKANNVFSALNESGSI